MCQAMTVRKEERLKLFRSTVTRKIYVYLYLRESKNKGGQRSERCEKFRNLQPLLNIICVQIQEKELSEAEGWVPGLRAFEWAIMRKRERETGRCE